MFTNTVHFRIRAAFHESGTFFPGDKRNPGGGDGNLRFNAFVGGNNGLAPSLAPKYVSKELLEGVSFADLYQIAGIVAIRHCGGPNIPLFVGRSDTMTPAPHVAGRLPDPVDNYDQIKTKYARMGLIMPEMAVLTIGAHTLGGRNDVGFLPFDETPGVFDNDIFKKVLMGDCPLPSDCMIAEDSRLRSQLEV
jgi:L-ascorbate peroxidase